MLSYSSPRAMKAVILPAFATSAPLLSATRLSATHSAFVSGLRCRPQIQILPTLYFSTTSITRTTVMTTTPTPTATSTAVVPPAEQDGNLGKMEQLELPKEFPKAPPLTVLGHNMMLTERSGWGSFALRLRLLRQIRGRLKKGTILTARLAGALPERVSPSARLFSTPQLNFSALTEALRCAAHDPRITHLHMRIDTLTCGWAKILELRRHIDLFASSGKSVTAYMETGGPKELFVAMGYGVYVAPQGTLSLRGFATSGSFVRGVLDKIGVNPQVERIGAYKSAGDQLARTSMADEQREVLNAILADINDTWSTGVCEATGIARADLDSLVDQAPWDMQALVDAGVISDVCYESQLIDALKLRFAPSSPFGKPDEKTILSRPLRSVDVARYIRRTTPRLLGLTGRKRIAVIRAVGAITGGRNSSSPATGSTVGSDTLVTLIRRARDDKRVAGVIIRCDSPGAALASDIIWHEVRALRAVKPVVASQGDVAASGGYFLSMAAGDIVSETLTLTGSVGVVAAKPSLGELYKRIGFAKENVSTGGRYAQLLVDDRAFTPEEQAYFRAGIELSYETFVQKAAASRGKTVEDMDKVAQGRVWTGRQAKEQGLVDHIGGMARAVEVIKMRCDIPAADPVRVEEFVPPVSLAERLGLSSSAETTSPAESLFDDSGPLAIADVAYDGTGVSPLSKLVIDALVTRLARVVPILEESQLQAVTDRLMKALTER